jgi:hypothetical protein
MKARDSIATAGSGREAHGGAGARQHGAFCAGAPVAVTQGVVASGMARVAVAEA